MDVLPFLFIAAAAVGVGYVIWLYRRRNRPLDDTAQHFGGGSKR